MNNESNTNVYNSLRGKREVVAVRCRPEVKEQLLKFCKANGLSICHVFEMLTTGYLTGMKQKIDWVNKSPTIQLSVVREVQRVRRYARESVPLDLLVESSGSSERCAFGCVGAVVAVHHVYADDGHCAETFVCERHHEALKLRSRGWRAV